MTTISKEEICKVFNFLNKSGLDYILLRNINNELPDNLIKWKDVDFLARKNDKKRWVNILYKIGFQKKILHPLWNDIRLYGVDRFDMFSNKNNGISLDFHYQLVCRSTNNREWIPLDKDIQNSAWKNRQLIKQRKLQYYALSNEDYFLHLITRCIFDKGFFSEEYIKEIKKYEPILHLTLLTSKFNKVFFKFTNTLLHMINIGEFNKIREAYISFSEY
jgi:hypothetical protein